MGTKAMTREELEGIIREVMHESLGAPHSDQGAQEVSEQQREWFATMVRTAEEAAERKAELLKRGAGVPVARMARALAACHGDLERAKLFAKQAWGEGDVAYKSLMASEADSGGVLVPEMQSAEVIELLRAQSKFMLMNPTVVPMPTGSVKVSRITGGATAHYINEAVNIPASQGSTDMITLNWKKLVGLVPISNDLLRFAAVGVDTMVRDDLVATLAIKGGVSFLRSDGAQDTPKGLLYLVNASNKFDAQATPDLAKVTQDLAEAILKLQEANVRFLRPGWLLAPRPAMYLRTVRDSNGNFAFRDEMNAGRLFGFPFQIDNNIPNNLGSGSDASEVYFADWADVLVGDAGTITLDASGQVAYVDSNSNLVSAFSRDETVVRAIQHHDVNLRHDKSVSVIEAVTWSPT